jgi:hypothetical protein
MNDVVIVAGLDELELEGHLTNSRNGVIILVKVTSKFKLE